MLECFLETFNDFFVVLVGGFQDTVHTVLPKIFFFNIE